MIAAWINKNYELAQMKRIREAEKNLKIALNAEHNYKKATQKEVLVDILDIGLLLGFLFSLFILAYVL